MSGNRQGLVSAGRLVNGAALGVIAAVVAAPALAQSAQSAPAVPDSSGAKTKAVQTVEEVVVTAERRATSLQKTAVAATVLTGADLKKRGVDNIDMLQFVTPSLNIQDTGTGALINIRGIGKSDGGQEVPPGTLIYRDGVSVTPGGILSDEPYYDIGNVEVLRGPQGTFAGQNATGGALFITEVDPKLRDFGGWVEGQFGNYNDLRLQGAVNIPVGDTFALRLATDDERRDSFYHVHGAYTGTNGGLDLGAFRASALWQPTPQFKAVLKVDVMDQDMSHLPGPFDGATSRIFDVPAAGHIMGEEHQIRSVLQLSYKFDNGITVRSITGYQLGKVATTMDANGAATVQAEETYHANSIDRTESEEINILSPENGRFQWVVGGVYQSDVVSQPNGTNWLSLAPGGTPQTGNVVELLQYRAAKDSWGVFGQGTLALTDTLKLQVGARYSESSFVLNSLDEVYLQIPIAPGFSLPFYEGQRIVGDTEKDSRLTGKINLEWNITPNNFLYAFVATGHKGGGVNGLGTLLPIIPGQPVPPASPAQLPKQFGPENVTDYEIGWKASAFGNRLHTQLGAFYYDYQDFQVVFFDTKLLSGIDVNAPGHTRIDGVEFQTQGQFGGWSFDFGSSYLDSAVADIAEIDSRDPLAGPQALNGKQQPYAPRWTVQAGVQYAFTLPGDATLTPRIDYGMQGSRWATLFEVKPTDYLARQDLFNAQIVYERPDNWRVTLYATNLFDEHYATSEPLAGLALAGPPRQFGVRLFKSF